MTSIRSRLLVMLLTGLIVVLLAGGGAVYWIARTSLMREFEAGLEARARTIASLVSYEGEDLLFDSGAGPAATLEGTCFELRTPEGLVLKRSDNLRGSALPTGERPSGEPRFDDVELPGARSGRFVRLEFRPRTEEPDEETVEEESEEDDEETLASTRIHPETLIVAAAVDRGPVDRALGTLLGTLIGVGAVLSVTVAGLVVLGVRWGLVPLDRLRHQLGRVDGATIARRLDTAGAPRELEPVYLELNSMLDRVERTLDRERSFVDAAAHELRTPLAELRTTAEVAIRWPDGDRAAAALRELLSIGLEMERLVESLLLISRGHATAMNGALDETAVAPIVRGCLERAAGSIDAKRLTLTVDLDERRSMRAPRNPMEIIVRNLIENAVQYTPCDGRISIRQAGDGEIGANGAPSLIVENDPVELDEDDLPRLFEPFWRREGSRSDRDHAGLGLAVVDRIAHAVGLGVDAELTDARLRIRVFPTS